MKRVKYDSLNLRIFIPLILVILILLLLWRGMTLQPNKIPSPLINKLAPNFELPDLFFSNKKITQRDFLGHVTLFNVWATWCYACAAEHDMLMNLAKHEHVTFIGLNYKDDTNEAKRWLQKKGNPYKKIAIDANGNVAIDWGVYGAPETYIIDQKGIIRYKYIGPITPESWLQELKPVIDKLDKAS